MEIKQKGSFGMGCHRTKHNITDLEINPPVTRSAKPSKSSLVEWAVVDHIRRRQLTRAIRCRQMKLRLLLSFGLVLLPFPVGAEEVNALPAVAQEANATTFLAIYDAARPDDKAHLPATHGAGDRHAQERDCLQLPAGAA